MEFEFKIQHSLWTAADGPATPPLMASPVGSPEGTPGLSSNENQDFPTTSSSVPGKTNTGKWELGVHCMYIFFF